MNVFLSHKLLDSGIFGAVALDGVKFFFFFSFNELHRTSCPCGVGDDYESECSFVLRFGMFPDAPADITAL